ncbi:unnamed protein product [Cladocopium goreaui]|uniref:Poly [ADP-ribose] polymerase n=1 Tax=Cladocopium goreaui TaxID=2562237 RepID=A0A9P1C7D5_9DINO|nr:unnamed protein product [Cladocopium goreaui]
MAVTPAKISENPVPVCPLCEKQKLRFSKVTGSYSCPGFFDDESKSFKRCKGPGDDTQLAGS